MYSVYLQRAEVMPTRRFAVSLLVQRLGSRTKIEVSTVIMTLRIGWDIHVKSTTSDLVIRSSGDNVIGWVKCFKDGAELIWTKPSDCNVLRRKAGGTEDTQVRSEDGFFLDMLHENNWN